MALPEPVSSPVRPWWREPMVWLVIGGPATVVVAGIATAVIAVRGADPIVSTPTDGRFEAKPAVQGRNHVATPPAPLKEPAR